MEPRLALASSLYPTKYTQLPSSNLSVFITLQVNLKIVLVLLKLFRFLEVVNLLCVFYFYLVLNHAYHSGSNPHIALTDVCILDRAVHGLQVCNGVPEACSKHSCAVLVHDKDGKTQTSKALIMF